MMHQNLLNLMAVHVPSQQRLRRLVPGATALKEINMPRYVWLAIAAVLALVGCGGGGTTGGGPGSANLAVFASDSLRTDYDQVWVRIYSATLVSAEGDQTVFTDPAGRVIDLRTLRDEQGARFTFLDNASVRAGQYSGLALEMDKTLTLVARGQTVGTQHQFPDQFDLPGQPDRSRLTFDFPQSINLIAGNQQFVIEFDLDNWQIQNGRVIPVVKRGSTTGINNRNRHEAADFNGQITNLTGTSPNQTFVLSRSGNRPPITVRTDSSTAVFRNDGVGSVSLQNGLNVKVTGVVVDGLLWASSVRVRGNDGPGDAPHDIKGTFSNVNAVDGSFTLSLIRARGFVPPRATVTVTTNANTLYFSNMGVSMTREEFFAAMQTAPAGSKVEAEGQFSGQTFSAQRLKLDIEDELNEAEVKGPVSMINQQAGSFRITAQEWEGISLTMGAQVTVMLGQNTTFMIDNQVVTRTQFFNALNNGTIVQAKGTFANNTITASRARIRQ
jgi:hypothetical protein